MQDYLEELLELLAEDTIIDQDCDPIDDYSDI